MKYIFNLEGFPSPLSGLVGIVFGIIVVLVSGYLGCRRFLDRLPMDILKNQL